ncbi:MAG TPA: DivIVA domain-containing protein [Nocardioidaceae bacterium]|nr:DivIVA domain-containing protein [Nocardioidaceae bacterium]
MSTSDATDRTFRHTRFGAGYATEEVDVFIDAVEDALRSPTPRLGSTDVARQMFTPVLFKPGYHMGDVDDYLSEAEHLLSEREHLLH